MRVRVWILCSAISALFGCSGSSTEPSTNPTPGAVTAGNMDEVHEKIIAEFRKPMPDGPTVVKLIHQMPADAQSSEAYLANSIEMRQLSLLKAMLESDLVAKEKKPNYLFQAVRQGDGEVIKIFMDAKIDPNPKNRQGLTPLILAVNMNKPDIVKALLAGGAKTEERLPTTAPAGSRMKDPDGMTALMVAAKSGYRDLVAMLVAAKADKSAKSASGKTAAELAKAANHNDIAKMLAS